jgi:hypothetical protein
MSLHLAHRRAAKALAAAAVAMLALALAACGGGSDSTSSTETAKAQPAAVVKLTATTHRPRVGAPWPITLEAHDRKGRPLRAEVRYQYLFGGAVVARRSHYRFRGVFHDTFHWPARAAGAPLTFRAVVTTPLGTRRLDYPVRVRK